MNGLKSGGIMNKIDILTFNNLKFPNGVNEVIKSFWEGKEIFQEKGIALNYIYGYDGKNLQNIDRIENLKKKIIVKNKFSEIKNKINVLANDSKILSLIIIYKRFIIRAKGMILKYLKKNSDADTIIFNDLFSAYFYLKYKKNDKRKRIILILHTNGNNFEQINIYYKNQFKFLKKYFLKLEKKSLEKVDKIVFVSKRSMLNFISVFPEYNDKTTYIYNGIRDIVYDKNKKNNAGRLVRFICVGNFNKRKGQEILIKAISKIKVQLKKQIKVIFIGGGPDLENCIEMAKGLEVNKNIEFLGIKRNSEEFLKNKDIFILPSYDEGLPIAIIEAFRQGMPVISTRVGGISEMIDEYKNGFLINPTEEDIIKIIEEILEKRYNLEELSKAAREKYLTNFTLEKMIKEYCKLIEKEGN